MGLRGGAVQDGEEWAGHEAGVGRVAWPEGEEAWAVNIQTECEDV